MKDFFDWLDRHRVLAISGLNALVILTLAILIGVVASEENVSEAESISATESDSSAEDDAAAKRNERRSRRSRTDAARGSSSRSAYRSGAANEDEGRVSSGSSKRRAGTKGSSFRKGSAPTRINWRGAPPPRDIESAENYGPWHMQQRGDEDALAELPPNHPLAVK